MDVKHLMNCNYIFVTSLIAAITLLGVLTGCQFKGDEVAAHERVNKKSGSSVDIWVPVPDRVRIYPSSRFVMTQNKPALEARVELQDVMGDSIKAAGVFHLELLENKQQKRDAMQQKLYSWDVPINTLEDQKIYFESVTRTYRFVLRLDRKLLVDEQLTLAVTFRRQDGLLLQTKAVLGPDGMRFGG